MNNTPVRQPVLANNLPVPQTTSGTLEQTGISYDPENITDIPPDFSWMSEMPFFKQSFTWPPASQPVSLVLNKFAPTQESNGTTFPWLAVPMSLHKYFNGNYFVRFTAVKPSRTPGKILVVYLPSGQTLSTTDLNSVRSRVIKKEWDLTQSNTFEMTIPGFNPNRMRVTGNRRRDPPTGMNGISLESPTTARDFGSLHLYVAVPYAPGSIFPDSFTIFTEVALQNPEFATPCDSHGVYEDFFST